MAVFDLNTPRGRFDFATNNTLKLAFQQTIIESASESIVTPGDGTAFPYFGNQAYDKIKPFLLSVFKSGIYIDRNIIAAFVSILPKVVVDEDDLTTTLYNTLKSNTKTWIEYREDVTALDKTTASV